MIQDGRLQRRRKKEKNRFNKMNRMIKDGDKEKQATEIRKASREARKVIHSRKEIKEEYK